MSKSHGSKVRGFTLAEVMVSLVIFMVASMGLLPLLLTNLQANRGNSLHAQARRLAGEAMTELQVLDYESLASVPEAPLLAGDVEIIQRVEHNRPQPDQSRITITARWQQQGHTHSYQLQTVRSAP